MIKVLIADDAAFVRLAIKTLLEKNGFTIVAEAEDGEAAVQKYKQFKPDIVTMDITMPKKTGIQALKEIMQFDPKAKIVMFSAMGQETLIKESVLNGAKSFLVKPYKEENVVKTLSKVAAL